MEADEHMFNVNIVGLINLAESRIRTTEEESESTLESFTPRTVRIDLSSRAIFN